MRFKGKAGKWAIRLLLKSPAFNRRFVVIKFLDAYTIIQSKPVEELRKMEINTSNILRFKFDIYDAFRLLKEYTVQVKELNEAHKQLVLNVWDSERMKKLIKCFSLSLTDQTYSELKQLLAKKVFSEKLGDNYNYFIFVSLHPDIKRKSAGDRRYAEGSLKYSLISEKDNKERRLKSKFTLSKQEAIIICANSSYWPED